MTYSTRRALADQLDAQEETFEEIQHALDHSERHEGQDAFDALHDEPLEVTQQRSLRAVLTTGGPHIVATADFDEDGVVENSRLIGTWGHERIERQVHAGSGLHRALQSYAEGFLL